MARSKTPDILGLLLGEKKPNPLANRPETGQGEEKARPGEGIQDQTKVPTEPTRPTLPEPDQAKPGFPDKNSSAPRPEEQEIHFVCFKVSERIFALPLDRVDRVLRMAAPTPVPQGPGWLMGLLSLAGETLPTLDLGALLGLPSQRAEPDQKLLIMPLSGFRLALMVNQVLDVIRVAATDYGPKPEPLAQSGQLAGLANHRDELILVLDGDGLLLPEDEQRLMELIEEAERRQA